MQHNLPLPIQATSQNQANCIKMFIYIAIYQRFPMTCHKQMNQTMRKSNYGRSHMQMRKPRFLLKKHLQPKNLHYSDANRVKYISFKNYCHWANKYICEGEGEYFSNLSWGITKNYGRLFTEQHNYISKYSVQLIYSPQWFLNSYFKELVLHKHSIRVSYIGKYISNSCGVCSAFLGHTIHYCESWYLYMQ